MAELFGVGDSKWVIRGTASAAVLLLSVINVAGVKWVIKLQFILLLILMLAGLDFMVGSFVHTDEGILILIFSLNLIYMDCKFLVNIEIIKATRSIFLDHTVYLT